MFQSFVVQSSPEQGPPRLEALRAAMAAEGLDVFLVPRADAHQGEYVAPHDARLAWLTGFTGSAGFCAVTQHRAGVFIDGRYRVQVRNEVADIFTPVHWPETGLADWLKADGSVATVGYDGWLHTMREIETLERDLPKVELRAVDNLVDRIWEDQPAPPPARFFAHPDEMAGEVHAAKRKRLGESLQADAAVITLPDSIAWLLNIRGKDIERNPVPHAFAILHRDGTVDLFCRAGKAEDVQAHLGPDVRVHEDSLFLPALEALTGRVQVDPASCPAVLGARLRAAGISLIEARDPCVLPKARKNDTEIANMRVAHDRDAAAMVRFLAWLDATAPLGGLTEIDVVTALEGFRAQTNALKDISFETICGAGPNGAIVHYRVSEKSNRPVQVGELLLVDSGGQYLDGTTDITRTVAIGAVGEDERVCYTRVLQGMIAISRIRFPRGVGGQHLDTLARAPLWLAGQDYDHGTGHGIGSYLCVHEGPQGISRRSEVALEEGMILSNEPGYYREGAFGIRIENLIVTVKAPPLEGADARDMLAFETLTFVPLDRRLIVKELLSSAEIDWIDAYHAEVQRRVAPRLDNVTKEWLDWACAPLCD